MIIDLGKFIRREKACWDELEQMLAAIEDEPGARMPLDQARRLHYLYERSSAALARISTFSSDEAVREHLESLVARAYAVVHSAHRRRRRFNPLRWFVSTLPQTFRRHTAAFALATAVMLAGCAFGGGAVLLDPRAKDVLMPFEGLKGSPAERVAKEESGEGRHAGEAHATFAAILMANNTKVALVTLALGITFGVGTITLLFYNGVIVGAVIVDYIRAGQSVFLAGWLLPHGVVEIPAILLAGQAGLMIASAMIGQRSRDPLKVRLRRAGGDIVTIILGVAVMLVWAGIVESFLSQYHQPVLPYWLKIALGLCELAGLIALLGFGGRAPVDEEAEA